MEDQESREVADRLYGKNPIIDIIIEQFRDTSDEMSEIFMQDIKPSEKPPAYYQRLEGRLSAYSLLLSIFQHVAKLAAVGENGRNFADNLRADGNDVEPSMSSDFLAVISKHKRTRNVSGDQVQCAFWRAMEHSGFYTAEPEDE